MTIASEILTSRFEYTEFRPGQRQVVDGYFGETRAEPCGHCSYCLTGSAHEAASVRFGTTLGASPPRWSPRTWSSSAASWRGE